jgi:predicted HTH domain antitoxin
MRTLSLPYPDDLLITSGKSPQALEAELIFLLAVKLFKLRRLSLGKAADFCNMNKLQFMYELGRLQVPVINQLLMMFSSLVSSTTWFVVAL